MLAKRTQPDQELKDMMRAARFAARPLRARGLTQPTPLDVSINLASVSVLPADPSRRLIVFVLVDADYFVQPLVPMLGTGDGIHVTAGKDSLLVKDDEWGVFTTCEWFARGALAPTTVRTFTETYLQ